MYSGVHPASNLFDLILAFVSSFLRAFKANLLIIDKLVAALPALLRLASSLKETSRLQ